MTKKFLIELEESYERASDGGNGPEKLWRVKGFNTLVFDEEGIRKLKAASGDPDPKTETLGDLSEGSTFTLGGIEWEILDKDYQGGVFVLAKESIEEKEFDENNCNNWDSSTARNYLNTDFKKHMEEQIGEGILMEFERDLTSDDGLKDYGTCMDHVSLISCDEYRRYRKYISNKSNWWWTLTPWSTPNSGNSGSVRLVYTDGSLHYYNAYGGSTGLAPALLLPSSTSVETGGREE